MARRYLLDQNETPLYDAVLKFADWGPVPFFIPSHKMGAGIDPRFKAFAGENIFKMDLSEVRWTDDFHGVSSSIKAAQELAADAFGAAHSFFLVNGTSGGVIAAVCAVCGEGDKIIIPRNAHKSAVYGLVISGAEPVYVMPELDREKGLVSGLAPETLAQAIERHPDAKAVFTVSPTYHGVMSDTKALAALAHRYGAVLIADEAHGNHVYFSGRLPKGALELGADIVCQSTHKMSGSLTQASMLHLGRGAHSRVDFEKVRANLSMIQTTSPSYLLLASLDMARSYIATQGEAVLGGVLDALGKAREDIGALRGIELLGEGGGELRGTVLLGRAATQKDRPPEFVPAFCLEPTRLAVSARALGIDGY
ncbi:MAG: aminotransferase class I/II-fold pyridoxal phosphate-dependent enzyme, partial [Clostridiales Family XIII bacterium]|nr:aminotransferase class I/II-fold pyridoxal phosphate-dependent enzyme [Clostridiales Family XIII bacterium]